MKYLVSIILALIVLASPAAPALASSSPAAPTYSGIPTFSITGVVTDQTVTIQTNNFPANQVFTVTMGSRPFRGIGGIVVGTTNSGAGGSFSATYNIPAALRGSYQIAIRLQSASVYFAYNWFFNNTTGGLTGGGAGPTYSGIPTFSIASVVRDQTVTIQTSNFPANQVFTVTMGYRPLRGVGGIVVGTTNSGAGGSFSATYNIPAALRGSNQIAIRLQSASVYFAYNWFFNNTTP